MEKKQTKTQKEDRNGTASKERVQQKYKKFDTFIAAKDTIVVKIMSDNSKPRVTQKCKKTMSDIANIDESKASKKVKLNLFN